MRNPYYTVESDYFQSQKVAGLLWLVLACLSHTILSGCIWVCSFPGLHISRHLSTPYCGICIPLYVVSLVVLVSNPGGSPFRFICLGYSIPNTLRDVTLPPALCWLHSDRDIALTITISWKVHNGICFCFPGSFDVTNHDSSGSLTTSGYGPTKCTLISSYWPLSSSISVMSVFSFFPWCFLPFWGVLCVM